MSRAQRWSEEEGLRAIAHGEIEVRRSARRKKTVAVSKEIETYVLRTPVRYSVEHNIRSLTDLFNRLSARDRQGRVPLPHGAGEPEDRV